LTSVAPPRWASRQFGLTSSSLGPRPSGLGLELAPFERRAGKIQRERLDRRVVADQHHRGDRVRNAVQPLEQRTRRRPRRGGARTSRRQPGAPPRSAQPSQAHVSPSSTTRARGRSRAGPGDARSPWPPAAPDPRAAAHDRSAQDASSSTSCGAAGTSARPNFPGRRSPGLAPRLGVCCRRLRGGLGCR
jgi:hypothetical protein